MCVGGGDRVHIYPARACAARGKVISRDVLVSWWCLYIYTFFGANLLSYSLSEVYFNTHRLLIKFNGLWYSLAAQQVFVAIANPDSLSLG